LRLIENLQKRPAAVITDNELLLLCIDDATLIRGDSSFREILDNPAHRFSKSRLILTEAKDRWKSIFPFIPFLKDWFTSELNNSLCENYFAILDQMFDQRDIGEYIIKCVDVDAIALVLVDGLSYFDSIEYSNVRPCMVPGPTTTIDGFSNIVQDGIVHGLYDVGFKKRYGFSFWDRKNRITDVAFKGFPPRSMHRIKEFKDALDILQNKDLNKSFIQILIQGYDQEAHGRHGRPLIDSIVGRIFRNYIPQLISLLKKKVSTSRVFLTADHGMWWVPHLEQSSPYEILNYKGRNVGHSRIHRNLKGYHDGSEFIHWETDHNTTSMLKYPHLMSKLKKNEWGKHGGVSIFESIVPFLEMEVV
jgi:hypothetical protein